MIKLYEFVFSISSNFSISLSLRTSNYASLFIGCYVAHFFFENIFAHGVGIFAHELENLRRHIGSVLTSEMEKRKQPSMTTS